MWYAETATESRNIRISKALENLKGQWSAPLTQLAL